VVDGMGGSVLLALLERRMGCLRKEERGLWRRLGGGVFILERDHGWFAVLVDMIACNNHVDYHTTVR
jgi:hypothetical protein